MIFVSTQAVEPVATFKEYCEDAKHGCAYIIPEVEEFELFYKFMGIPQHEYYIIVNALERKKYVLSKPPTSTTDVTHSLKLQVVLQAVYCQNFGALLRVGSHSTNAGRCR